MANASPALEFTDSQRDLVRKLALLMKGVAAVLLLIGAIDLLGGAFTLFTVAVFPGLLSMVEGAVAAFLGLVMVRSAADVRFMADTKYTSVHLGHAFRDLGLYYQCQLLLAVLLIIRAFFG
jgi:hypothetical protein